ncbi:MAG: hypothetical protein MK142_11025 [Pseudomonadales bacterium]|nr:hypothetical protein [Pseudomonadales bacterium]
MTTAFVDAAETMAGALGRADYPFAVIEHPVSSATDAGLEARARAVAQYVAAQLEQS